VTLFHITSKQAWAAAQAAGEYRAPSLVMQGFIHLSEERQWPLTQRRFYTGQSQLVLLVIRREALRAEVRFEPADGDSFPHLFGPLNLDAVVEVRQLASVS
jgi:uncharacterized protein (DUF952 family)